MKLKWIVLVVLTLVLLIHPPGIQAVFISETPGQFEETIPSDNPLSPAIEIDYPTNQTLFCPAANRLVFRAIPDGTNTIAITNIQLVLNGTNVSSGIWVEGSSTNRQVSYSLLVPNQVYQATAVVRDDAGGTSLTHWVFDTLVESNAFTVEAEHYNFEGGKFINNPVVSYDEGPSNYLNRIAVEGIDTHQISTDGTHLFRPFDLVGIDLSGDALRPDFITSDVDDYIDDYSVGWIEIGEWLNYTRVFSPGYYTVYARVAPQDAPFIQAQLDEVVSGSTSGLQTLAPRGVFRTSETPGQDYVYVPLSDGFGQAIGMRLSGQKTLRFTANNSGFLFNYLIFVPTPNPGTLLPVASSVYPQPGATGIMPDVTITVTIADQDTQVVPSSIKLFLNGTNLSETALVLDTAYGANVSYRPTNFLPYGHTNTVGLVYGDNSVPQRLLTNEWTFVTVTNLITLSNNLAFPVSAGLQRGLTFFSVQGPEDPILANTIQRAEEQLAGVYTNSGVLVPTESQALTIILSVNHTVRQDEIVQDIKSGHFGDDQLVPGLGGHTNNIATEVVAYLALNRGSYRFGVNSDDGFRLTAGRQPADTNLVLGQFDGTREASDTQFDFLVEVNGVYAFRLLWEQGTGDGSVEWFSVDRLTGARTLINDTTMPGAILAFRQVAGNFAPIGISLNPTNLSVIANQPARFQVAVTNTVAHPGRVIYQWQVNGVDILGANSSNYFIPQTSLNDSGRTYHCIITVPGYASRTSADALLTVQEDNLPPQALKALGGQTLDTVRVSFSEPMDPISAQDPANFTLSGGLSVLGVSIDTTGTNVTLTTSPQTEGTFYTLTITNVTDTTGLPIASDTTLTFTSFALAVGFLQQEIYLGVPGTNVFDLESTDKFALGQYDSLAALSQFAAPQNAGDNYGQKVSGYLIPPASGTYVFYIASEDSSELRLSASSDPTTKTTVASVDGRTAPQEWNKYPATQSSPPIGLEAGHRYYIEAVHKAGTGNDHLTVGWTTPSQSGQIQIIDGQFLASFINPDTTPPKLSIMRQSTNVVVSWPLANKDYVLEASMALPATNWSAVSQPAGTNESSYSVTLPSSGNQNYYRLRR
jgi:hypothetical protein